MKEHEVYMRKALAEARKAYEKDEVPIGAVVVLHNQVIASGFNQVELLNDSTAHAEIIALTSAYQSLGTKYLPEATLYVTIEPCLMCCGALYWSKIKEVVYGAADPKNGYRRSTGSNPAFHPKTKIITGVLQEDCLALMHDFFANKRKK